MEFSGKLDASKLSFAIVVSRFNESITRNLLLGATDLLKRCGAEQNKITTAWVPGAFEIPLIAKTMAKTGKYHAIICLGAVIRGATSHFDFVAGQAASGIMQTSLETETPITFGILTTETLNQAIERSGTKGGNKGSDAAQSAIEMANLKKLFTENNKSKSVKANITDQLNIKELIES